MAEEKKKSQLYRQTVLLGKYKRSKKEGDKEVSKETDIYSSVTKRAVTELGLTVTDIAKGVGDVEVRGTRGAGSIRVAKTPGGKKYSVPVPGWFKIQDMREFIQKNIATAENFTAPSGRVYSVGKAKAAAK